jgi:proteasome lid subunit RPN8/RPN11
MPNPDDPMPPVQLILRPAIARRIEQEGVRAFPDECCGILIGREVGRERRIVEQLVPMANAFDPAERYHRFTIDPRAQIAAEKQADVAGLLVLGYYHSHPDHPAVPSEYDRQHMPPWSFYSQVIVSIRAGRPAEMTAWQINEETGQFEPQRLDVAAAEESVA